MVGMGDELIVEVGKKIPRMQGGFLDFGSLKAKLRFKVYDL
jgi:hypothetical protein